MTMYMAKMGPKACYYNMCYTLTTPHHSVTAKPISHRHTQSLAVFESWKVGKDITHNQRHSDTFYLLVGVQNAQTDDFSCEIVSFLNSDMSLMLFSRPPSDEVCSLGVFTACL